MASALLNYTPYPYQVFVGNLDCTYAVENFSIQRPRADINQPYSWSGTLTLADPLDRQLIAESLDDLINPARWAKGVEQVKFYFQVDGVAVLFCTMRILEYFYNESTGVATLELGDILKLLDYKTPAKDYKGLNFPACTSITVGEIATRAMNEAGVPAYSINQSSKIEVAPNKPDASWILWAQKYLGERGYFLYCEPNETVTISRYPTVPPATALLSRARSEVEEFERAQSPDIPVEKYIVTASPEKFAKCGASNNSPEIEEEYGYIIASDGSPIYCLERRVTTYPTVSTSNYEKTKTIVEQARGAAFPSAYPGSITMVIVERIDEKKSYDLQNRLVMIERYSDKPLALLLPEEFPAEEGYTYLINNIEATVEEFSEGLGATSTLPNPTTPNSSNPNQTSQGIMRRRTKTTWSVFPVGLQAGTYTGTFGTGTQTVEIPFGLDWTIAIKEKTIETWKGGGKSKDANTGSSCVCDRYKYKKRVYQRPASFETDYEIVTNTFIPKLQLGALQLKSNLSKNNDGDTPPAWQVKEADCPTCTDVVKGEATVLPVAYTPFIEREKEIQASTIQNQVEAEYLADLIGGAFDWARYHQRQVAMPVPKELLLDPAPFHRVDIHNGAFIVDNPIITLGDDGMEFAFIGNYLGAIPEIQPQTQAALVFNLVG